MNYILTLTNNTTREITKIKSSYEEPVIDTKPFSENIYPPPGTYPVYVSKNNDDGFDITIDSNSYLAITTGLGVMIAESTDNYITLTFNDQYYSYYLEILLKNRERVRYNFTPLEKRSYPTVVFNYDPDFIKPPYYYHNKTSIHLDSNEYRDSDIFEFCSSSERIAGNWKITSEIPYWLHLDNTEGEMDDYSSILEYYEGDVSGEIEENDETTPRMAKVDFIFTNYLGAIVEERSCYIYQEGKPAPEPEPIDPYLIKDMGDSNLFYHLTNIEIPDSLEPGEYTYTLTDMDGNVVATGLSRIGDLKHLNTEYDEKQTYKQYTGK